MLTVQVDTSGLTSLLQNISTAYGVPARNLFKASIASMLKTCVNRTGVARKGAITRNSRTNALRDYSKEFWGGNGRRIGDQPDRTIRPNTRRVVGRMWFKAGSSESGGKRFVLVATSGSNVAAAFKGKPIGKGLLAKVAAQAQSLASFFERRSAEGDRAAGLAANSWVQMAEAVGLNLMSAAGELGSRLTKALAARPANGRSYANGSGNETRSGNGVVIQLTNDLPYNDRLKMQSTLQRAVKGQERYTEENLKRGVFRSIDEVGRRYPFYKRIS